MIFRGRKANEYLNAKADWRQKLNDEFLFSSNDVIITHVGRQEFQKGHLELLKAIKSIDQVLADNKVKFLFCGRDAYRV